MKTDYEMIMDIRKRPGLYFRRKSFNDLLHFSSGYEICLRNLQLIKGKETFSGFDEFVKAYYKDENMNISWPSIILTNSQSDEEAFDNFFRLHDLHLEAHPELIEEEKARQEKYHKISLKLD